MPKLILGSRGSALALVQSRTIAASLEQHGHQVEVRTIRTLGDRVQDRPLPEIGGKGLFTAELDRALLDGEIDLAVHSLKDLPTMLDEGLSITAIPKRAAPNDALIAPNRRAITLMGLPTGARIGTSSLRRTALTLAFRPDLRVVPIRGNVDTRISKLDEGQVDALILAAAGLERLGLSVRTSHVMDRTSWIPAPGQGALGVVTRSGSGPAALAVGTLDHEASRVATTFERAFLATIGGGCSAPVGALGLTYRGGLRGWAMVASPDGRRFLRADATGDGSDPTELGKGLASLLIDRGARDLLTHESLAEGLPR